MAKNKPAKSKRQLIREQRQKRERRQRLMVIGAVVLGALLISGLLIFPSLRDALTPVGDIASVTPHARTQVDGNALGDPNAPVLIEVWEDFQCPSCKTYSTDIEPLVVQNYVDTGKARYVFRHYPFIDNRVVTKESDQAANASMCASEQDKFWEYHDTVFANWNGENLGAFSDRRLQAFAENIGLDMAAFEACFSENRYQDQINADIAAGDQAGVTGTPSVFVNGQQITPGFIPSYQEIATAVEAALGN